MGLRIIAGRSFRPKGRGLKPARKIDKSPALFNWLAVLK